MPAPTPELTQKRIIRAYETTTKSQQAIADEFGVSLATVKRLVQGRTRAAGQNAEARMEVAKVAIAQGAEVTVDGVNIVKYLADMAADLKGDMGKVEPKSKEGIANSLLKVLQFSAEITPPTLEQAIETLLDRPDFDPQVLRDTLRRHAQKAG